MNRDITSIYKAYARSNRLHPVLLVSATFDSGTLRFWNGYSTLSYDGNDYTGAGNLISITSSAETEELKANGISIGLSGIDSTIISLALTQPVAGRPIDIKMGFLSGDPQEILNYNISVSSGLYYVEQGQQPIIYVIEGQTYRFDQSDSSNSGHNLRISETSDGTHGGGTQYTNGFTEVGTAGTSGAYNQWVVPTGIAGTFYYYCQNHSGMGGQINVSTDFILFEPFTLFDGQMDKMDIQDNGETANVQITCESKLITLQTPRLRRYTLEDQKLDFPNDLGLEFIPSLQDKVITWGRG